MEGVIGGQFLPSLLCAMPWIWSSEASTQMFTLTLSGCVPLDKSLSLSLSSYIYKTGLHPWLHHTWLVEGANAIRIQKLFVRGTMRKVGYLTQCAPTAIPSNLSLLGGPVQGNSKVSPNWRSRSLGRFLSGIREPVIASRPDLSDT